MKEKDDEKGEEGRERGRRGMKQERAPSDENDGVVSERNNSGEQEDHEVAEESEARAELKQVDIHSPS